jgi:YVTN family beta-propeller protein
MTWEKAKMSDPRKVLSEPQWRGSVGPVVAMLVLAMASNPALGQPAGPIAGASGTVYTANELGRSVSAIELATGRVTTVATEGPMHNVQITADGQRLLAVGEGAAHEMPGMAGVAEGLLLVFNAANLQAGPTTIHVGEHPAHVVADEAGQYAYVTLSEEDAVAVVDLARGEVIQTIETGQYPHGLRISPDGRWLYVANVIGDSVSVIDTATLVETARVPVGDAPVQVGFTPDSGRVYVSLRDENSVAVIETATRTVTDRIEVGEAPIQVHVTPDGRHVYVANQGTDNRPSDTVSVIDVATGTVIDTIRTGAGAHGVAVSTDGRYVFVTNIVANTLSVIATENRSVIATFEVGGGPNGVTYRPEG